MEIMTTLGPTPGDKLVNALREDIQLEDSGIDVIPLETPWGYTLKLARQGRNLPWRITTNKQGECGIYKPVTSTLPAVCISLPPKEHLFLRDYLLEFIRRGWI